MHWLADYWWVLLILLFGMILNSIKDLNRLDPSQYLKDREAAAEKEKQRQLLAEQQKKKP